MKINILGSGPFGRFLRELTEPFFEFGEDAKTVILAVPISAYNSLAKCYIDRHLVNVCSTQGPSTDILLRHTANITCIHPLFGRNTPADKRYAIVTRVLSTNSVRQNPFAGNEAALFDGLSQICKLHFRDYNGNPFSPGTHDRLMARTHIAALVAAKRIKRLVERADDVPDEYLPNSFRLLRQFVATVDQMPIGTVQSIMANPFRHN